MFIPCTGILCTAAWVTVAGCVQKPCLRHAFYVWNILALARKPSVIQYRITKNYLILTSFKYKIYETDVRRITYMGCKTLSANSEDNIIAAERTIGITILLFLIITSYPFFFALLFSLFCQQTLVSSF